MNPQSIAALFPMSAFTYLREPCFRKAPHDTTLQNSLCARRVQRFPAWAAALILSAGLLLTTRRRGSGAESAEESRFRRSGSRQRTIPPNWATRADSVGKAVLTDKEAHAGRHAVAIPAHTSVEQKVGSVHAGSLPGPLLGQIRSRATGHLPAPGSRPALGRVHLRRNQGAPRPMGADRGFLCPGPERHR